MNAKEIAQAMMNLDSFDTFRATEENSIEKLSVLIAEQPEYIIEWLEESEEKALAYAVRDLAGIE